MHKKPKPSCCQVIISFDEIKFPFRRRTVTSTARSKSWEIEPISCRRRSNRESARVILMELQRPRSSSTRRRHYCSKRMNSDIKPGRSNCTFPVTHVLVKFVIRLLVLLIYYLLQLNNMWICCQDCAFYGGFFIQLSDDKLHICF